MNLIKRMTSLVCVTVLTLSLLLGVVLQGQAETTVIDNSSLLPAYVPDSQVTLDANGTPDWVKTAIFGVVNLNTATAEGTLEASIKVLDHYAEMGVNCIWVLPVYGPGTWEYPNGYENLGTHTINPKLTGTGTDYEAGWKKMGWFVEEAHKRNIRILLDVISWGVQPESPLLTQHPEFIGDDNGSGSYYFNWANDDFKEWYISTVVKIGLTTGCDGFRYDTEPGYAGYEVDGEIRRRLWAAGRKPLMMSERENERGDAYDIGQSGMTEGVSYTTYKSPDPVYFWLDKYNIVDSIQEGANYGTQASQELGFGGTYHYYTFCITNHDNAYTVVNGNRAAVGYQAMYTPFLPVMLLGEEWGNPQHNSNPVNPALYFNKVDWSPLDQPAGRALYEDIKAMIRLRRSYPEVFAYYPDEFKDANICKVNVAGCEVSQPYARYRNGKAFLVIPNTNIHDTSGKMTVYMPFKDAELDYYKQYTVTNALTGEKIVSGSASKVAKFTVTVPHNDQLVLMVEASGKIVPAASEETGGEELPEEPGDESVIEEPEQGNTEPEYETVTVTKKKKKKNQANGGLPVWPFVVGGVALVGIGGGTAAVLLVRKRKKAGQAEK